RRTAQEIPLAVTRFRPEEDTILGTIAVPPAYSAQIGLVMQIGPIVAVRRGSPAELAGVRAKDPANEAGDIHEAVELPRADGTRLRFSVGKGNQADPKVEERTLDPVRLPFELRRWADA